MPVVSFERRFRLLNQARAVYSFASVNALRVGGRDLSLTALMNVHGSDKGTVHGYSAHFLGGHAYSLAYAKRFEPFRNRAIRFLEIGIGIPGEGDLGYTSFGTSSRGGASLKAWREYFPKSQIFGADINDASFLDGPRLRTFITDQSSREALQALKDAIGEPLDITIDDGSHASAHQQITLAAMLPMVASEGLYIVEDLEFQPPSLEGPDDVLTAELLGQLRDTGKFASPVLSAAEQAYVEARVSSVEIVDSPGKHTGQVAFLTVRDVAQNG